MDVDHKIQKDILLKLIHNPEMTFSQLCEGHGRSNQFAYHLGIMEQKGLVDKHESLYTLSAQGKTLSSFIEGDTGDKATAPIIANGLFVRKGNKILTQKRLKEPFFGIWSLISGKINFSYNLIECAIRDLKEETGLIAKKGFHKGINQAKTYDENGKLIHHHIIHYIELENISGNLIEKTHKGENKWVSIEEFKTLDRFPDPWFDEINSTKGFIIMETERFMKEGKFVDCKIVSKKEFSS